MAGGLMRPQLSRIAWAVFGPCLVTSLAWAAPPEASPTVPLLDCHGDRLPAGAIARLGTIRFRGPLARSPDGKALTTLRDNCVVFIDPDSGSELRRLPGPDPRLFETTSFELS